MPEFRQPAFKAEELEMLKTYFSRQPDVGFAVLFGSLASGKSNPMSDVDIAVYFEEKKAKLEMGDRQVDITCAVMEMLRRNRVDIVVLNHSDPFLRFQVIKNGRLLYARDVKFFYRFKAAGLGQYQDIKPMYELYYQRAENALRRGMHG